MDITIPLRVSQVAFFAAGFLCCTVINQPAHSEASGLAAWIDKFPCHPRVTATRDEQLDLIERLSITNYFELKNVRSVQAGAKDPLRPQIIERRTTVRTKD